MSQDVVSGIRYIQAALEKGYTYAGVELAGLEKGHGEELVNYSRSEKAKFLEDAARQGHAIAALNIYYEYADLFSADDLADILVIAATRGSTAAKEILERWGSSAK